MTEPFFVQAVNWEAERLVLQSAVAELKAVAAEQATAHKQLEADKKAAQVEQAGMMAVPWFVRGLKTVGSCHTIRWSCGI